MRLIVSKLHDPFVNLALETALFKNLSALPNKKQVFVYFNDPCIVIGRNQNPFKECLITPDVPILRRHSGGGSVVHDRGVANISLQTSKSSFNRQTLLLMMQHAFPTLNMEINKRHDLQYQGCKVSGSAFKIEKNVAYHHATLLLTADLPRLGRLLKPDTTKGEVIESLGTESVKSKVLNTKLSETDFVTGICQVLAVSDIEFADESWITDEVQTYINELKSWEHTFGKTPKFKIALNGAELDVEKGVIQNGNLAGTKLPL